MNEVKKEVTELDWRNMVQAIAGNDELSNYVAVCDASASMKESTRSISISMGLLISELSTGPLKQAVYVFHASPSFAK